MYIMSVQAGPFAEARPSIRRRDLPSPVRTQIMSAATGAAPYRSSAAEQTAEGSADLVVHALPSTRCEAGSCAAGAYLSDHVGWLTETEPSPMRDCRPYSSNFRGLRLPAMTGGQWYSTAAAGLIMQATPCGSLGDTQHLALIAMRLVYSSTT